jgi:predicted nucleic acid-binding protein
MTDGVCDTDVLVRLVAGDDPVKQDRAIELFQRVEQGSVVLSAPDTVIADAVFVLASPRLYGRSRSEIVAKLATLIRLPRFHVDNKQTVLLALHIFSSNRFLDFGNAMVVAHAQLAGDTRIYSHDRDFDRVPGLERREP